MSRVKASLAEFVNTDMHIHKHMHLDVDAQKVGGQEAQRQLALALEAEQLHGVYQLLRRHVDVDHAKVLAQPMTHKHAAAVHQVPATGRWHAGPWGARMCTLHAYVNQCTPAVHQADAAWLRAQQAHQGLWTCMPGGARACPKQSMQPQQCTREGMRLGGGLAALSTGLCMSLQFSLQSNPLIGKTAAGEGRQMPAGRMWALL